MSCHDAFWKASVWQGGVIFILSIGIAFSANFLRPTSLPIRGDWSPESRMIAESGESLVISLKDAQKHFEAGDALFLDARPLIWFEEGHIKGARSLPPEHYEEIAPKLLAGFLPHRLIITYCDGEGCELSHDLALMLRRNGFSRVRILVNGWSLWSENGLPVEKVTS